MSVLALGVKVPPGCDAVHVPVVALPLTVPAKATGFPWQTVWSGPALAVAMALTVMVTVKEFPSQLYSRQVGVTV